MDPETPSLYERLLNRPPEAAAPPPRSSAAVVPWRRGPADRIEVYGVRRSPTLRFMGGFHAFPGGGLSRSDAAIPVSGHPAGSDGFSRSPAETVSGEALPPDLVPGLLAAVLRELFEETPRWKLPREKRYPVLR